MNLIMRIYQELEEEDEAEAGDVSRPCYPEAEGQ